MVEPINQIILFCYCLLVGLITGLFYLIFKSVKYLTKNNVFIGFSLDFALFLFAGLGMFILFLKSNGAQISFAGIMAFILGFIIIKVTFSYLFAFINGLINIKIAKFSFKNAKNKLQK